MSIESLIEKIKQRARENNGDSAANIIYDLQRYPYGRELTRLAFQTLVSNQDKRFADDLAVAYLATIPELREFLLDCLSTHTYSAYRQLGICVAQCIGIHRTEIRHLIDLWVKANHPCPIRNPTFDELYAYVFNSHQENWYGAFHDRSIFSALLNPEDEKLKPDRTYHYSQKEQCIIACSDSETIQNAFGVNT